MATASIEQTKQPTMAERRKVMDDMIDAYIATFGPLSPNLEEFWIEVPTSRGWKSKTKIIRPKNATSAPLVVMFHGGGWQAGSPAQVTRPAREWAEAFGVCVACPSYSLLPEASWPTPMQDGYDALCYLSSNAEKELGVDLSAGFIVGGISAGALLSAISANFSVNSKARELGGQVPNLAKPLTGVYLGAPGLIPEDVVPEEYKPLWKSMDEFMDAKPFGSRMFKAIWDMFGTDTKSPWFSPVHTLSLTNDAFPSTYFQACGLDPYRDDAVVFEKMLSSRGTKTKIEMLAKDGHGGWCAQPQELKSTNPTPEEATMGGMEWLLRG
jgi:acetyl esterase